MDERTANAVMALLEGFDSVAAARIGADGRVTGARGFLAELLPRGNLADTFRNPSWAQLQGAAGADAAQPVFRGPVTLATSHLGEQSFNAAIWRGESGWFLLAERVADDIEHLSKATVRLANDLAAARSDLAEAKRDLTEREKQVRVMSFVDRITGLGNRRAFNQALAAEVLRASRYGGPLCIVLAAIDGLEGITGNLGDDRAAEVLRCFARVVCNETRQTDQACRFGDNQFMLILTQTPLERATRVTDRIRVAFAAASPGMVGTTVTASFGYTEWRKGEDAGSMLDRAETALRAATAAGGDRAATG
jgi:diguanylate cyclase (GGDEF)-like protein